MQKLGQHFLINKAAIGKIIAALDIQKGDTIVEIGPGKGALTLPLIRKCSMIDSRNQSGLRCKVIAIEKDPSLAFSVERLGFSENLEVVAGDALKILPDLTKRYTLTAKRFKVVGNIPYYITGKLLRIIGELENKPKLTVLTVQKEVAERIVAKPPKMNLLAAAVQIWAEPEIIMNLKPKDFSPPPKVESAIIKLESRIQNLESRILERYYGLIKAVFKQPRKTVLNNLSTPQRTKEEVLKILKKAGLKGDERPQNLSLSQILLLSRLLE